MMAQVEVAGVTFKQRDVIAGSVVIAGGGGGGGFVQVVDLVVQAAVL